MVHGKINRDRHTDHPAGRHCIWTNQCPPAPSRQCIKVFSYAAVVNYQLERRCECVDSTVRGELRRALLVVVGVSYDGDQGGWDDDASWQNVGWDMSNWTMPPPPPPADDSHVSSLCCFIINI